jgi:hypothetical protein
MTQPNPASGPAKARLYTVEGPIDRPRKGSTHIEVQFNPTSLKVSMSNSLKENESSGNSRAAQFVDKSSSNLAVELIFDTTEFVGSSGSGSSTDVRVKTRSVANTFMTTTPGRNAQQRVPKRCWFQWGSFAFIGIMESFDETLEFFSPEGTPLRATLALKLSESRIQTLRGRAAGSGAQQPPQLSSPGEAAPVDEANSEAGSDEQDWRDTSLFNGIESPRLPSVSAVAVPGASVGAGLGASVSISGGAGFSAGVSGGASVSAMAGLTPPAFRFGASASLGTGIAGAFSADTKAGGGLSAGALASGGATLRAGASASASAPAGARVSAAGIAGAGFD